MATYFSVDTAFWTDADVIDNFTPEDKYFYLYLLTSPHCNISGCFELSLKQASTELGYSRDTVEHLIERFISVHKMIDYDRDTKEILVHKWGKHHWTHSDKYISALKKKICGVKSDKFRAYLSSLVTKYEETEDMVWIPYTYGMDTSFLFFNNNIPLGNEESIESNGGVGEEREERDDADEAKIVVDKWNSTRLPQVVRVRATSERGKRLRARIREFGVDEVIKAVDLAADSDFLQEQHWFDFGWFVRPENFVKVLEGKYNRNGIRENRRNGYDSSGGKDQNTKSKWSEFRPSLDYEDQSTWGA